MRILKPEQVQAMNQLREAEYHRRLLRYFRANAPELVQRLSDDELESRIAKSVSSAQGYSISSDEGILSYVALSLAAGPTFDEDMEVSRFMLLPDHDPESKLDWLMKRIGSNLKGPT